MTCCGQTRGGDGRTGEQAQGLPSEVRALADDTPVERVLFEAARVRTGTALPVIAEDGEGLRRQHRLKAFEVEKAPVTNARFAAFVSATGYVTVAERFGWSPVFRGLLDDPDAVPAGGGGAPWWGIVDGACWYAPEGPGSTVSTRGAHPVTHIAWEDARAFADWAGGRLPSEAEWEHAARGGVDGDMRFPWGDREPDDTSYLPVNIFQGRFPAANTEADGYAGTSPVGAFAPNSAGLFDMIGNVWEWTAEPFVIRSASKAAKQRNAVARAGNEKLMKGGSFLCHASYCYRYRIAARFGLAADSGGCNAGFRVFYDAEAL